MAQFMQGMKVKLFEIGVGEIDEAILESVDRNRSDNSMQEVVIKSLRMHPGEKATLSDRGSSGGTWWIITEDPFQSGVRCFSQRGPVYSIVPA